MRTLGRALRLLARAVWLLVSLGYVLVTRVALHGAALYLVLYFTLNTELFSQQLMRVLSTVLPGRVSFETLVVQPTLVDVVVVGAVIEDGLGRPVISCGIAYATVDAAALVANVAAQAADPDVLPMLPLSRARAVRPDVVVEVESDAWTGIGTAFYDRSKPKGPRSGFRTEIHLASVVDGRVRVSVLGDTPVLVDSQGLNIPLGDVVTELGRTWANGPLATAVGGRVVAGGVELPFGDLQARDVDWSDGVFRLSGGKLTLSSTPMTLSGGLDRRGREVRLQVRASAALDDEPLLLKRFGVAARGTLTLAVDGPLSFPELRAELVAERLEAAGYSLGPIKTGIELRTDPWRDVVALEPTVVEIDGEPLFIDELVWERAGANDPRDDGAIRVSLRAPTIEAPALEALGVPALPGFSGDVTASARFSRPGWRANSQPLWHFAGRIEAAGEARKATPYPRGAGMGLLGEFGGALSEAGLRVEAPSLVGWLGTNDLALDGRLAANGTLDVGLQGSLNLKRMGLAFRTPPLRGTARLQNAHVRGPLNSPTARFDLQVRKGRYADVRVETLTARARYADGLLETRELSAVTSLGRVSADASLRLMRGDALDPLLTLTVPKGRIDELNLAGTLTTFGRPGLWPAGAPDTATVDVTGLSLPLGAGDPLGGLVGRARARVASGRLLDEMWRGVEFDVSVERRTLTIEAASATSETGAQLTADGSWHFPAGRPGRFDGTAKLRGLELERFGGTRGRGVSGRIDAELVAGAADGGLTLKGALQATGLAVGGIALGNGALRLERRAGESRVQVDSPSFFKGFTLEKGTAVLGPSGLPEKLAFTVGFSQLDLGRFGIGGERGAKLESATLAHGSVSVALEPGGRTPFSAVLDLPDGALQLSYDGIRVQNRGVLSARSDGTRIELERAIAAIGPYALAACGSVDVRRGQVELDVAGSLQVADVPGLRRVANGLQGRLVTDGPDFADSCLLLQLELEGKEALGDPRGFIRISDALDAPKIVGALRLDGIALRPRGLGKELTIDRGDLLLRFVDGLQKVIIDEDQPLTGSLEDGNFVLSGEVALPKIPVRRRLQHWLPDRGRLRLEGQDLVVAAPKEYRFTVDPSLELRFENVFRPSEKERARFGLSPAERDLRLVGQLDLPEGEYFSGFTVISKALGRVLERGVAAGPTRDLSAALPWLPELKLDVRVHAASLAIQSDFGVGATDLDTRVDLNVRGSYGNPLLYGNVTVTDGTVSYNVFKREFEVTEGRLEFDGPVGRPMLDIRAESNIEVRKQNRLADTEDLEDYAVTVTVKGRVPDYQIAFSSKPSLPEIDVQYLILLGRTKQQLADEGASGGSLELVSADLSTLVTSLVEAPFVDELVVEPTLGGGGRVEAVLRLGRGIRIGLVGRQETTGARSYDARYRHRLLDQLILEATRRSATETTGERDRYEVQLQYTIPLD